MTTKEQSLEGLIERKFKLTPLRRKVLTDASQHNLTALPLNEEKAAFALEQAGLLHASTGMCDYIITEAGLRVLSSLKEHSNDHE